MITRAIKTCSYAVALLICCAFAQEDPGFDLSFDVNRVYQPLSIDQAELAVATSISDLHPHYRPAWVKEFISVSIVTTYAGKTRTATALDDTLSPEQLTHLRTTDIGSDVAVSVKYMPDNTLSHNDPQEFDFTFVINPDQEATFPGGPAAMDLYIKQQAVDRIAASAFKQHRVHAVQFTIDEEGQVIDAHIAGAALEVYPEQSNEINEVLLKAVCQMPRWEPASYADGTKAKQDFMLTAGDKYSCTYNLLNIRHDPEELE